MESLLVGVCHVSPSSEIELLVGDIGGGGRSNWLTRARSSLVPFVCGKGGGGGDDGLCIRLTSIACLISIFLCSSSSLDIVELHSDATVRLDKGRSRKRE